MNQPDDSQPVRVAWDSRFFGFPVGAVSLFGGLREQQLFKCVKTWSLSGFRLIYVFVDESAAGLAGEILERAGAVAVGTRVTYRKMYGNLTPGGATGCVAATEKSPALENLAYTSGAYSRFARDERLRPFFRRLYGTWLEKELSSGRVFVFPDRDYPVGMATATLCEDHEPQKTVGRIGLAAVAEQHRRRGIAKHLLETVETWLLANGASGCEVVTQGGNVAARALYERFGFHQVSETGIWHLWLSPKVEEAQ